jgi:DNA topoisomerase-3
VKDPRIKQLLISRDKGKVGENGGIGTPATRSNIIKVLRERNFYQIEKKKLIPTELGISFIKLLPELATAPDMTALWHEQQLMIEKGELTVDDFLDELEIFIAGQVATADVTGIKIDRHSCECGGFYKQHKGEHGLFWGCSNYPACKNSLPDNNGKPNFKANIRPEIKSKCPKCGSRIAVTSKMCACTGCDFRLYPIVFQKTLSLNQVENLLTNFKLPVVKGLIKNNGDKFEAALILNKTTWRIEPDFSVPKVVAKKKVVKRF